MSNIGAFRSQDLVTGETHIDRARRQVVEVIDSILVDFDGRFNDDAVGMLSSMKCICPHEMNSISHSDE